jgi:tetratricopeptide (TPR) repeat protein
LQRPETLGQTFAQFGLTPNVQVPVAPDVIATMAPCPESLKLLLAEVHQSNGQSRAALDVLNGALPDAAHADADPVVLAAYGELAMEADDQESLERFLKTSAALLNDSPVHTVVLYYRALALFKLGMHHAALEVITPALRRTKGRNAELMLNLRYLRAQVYDALGKKAQARADFERIYAQDPTFEDVAQSLGQ